MAPWRITAVVASVAMVLIYAGGANYWNRDYTWYKSLNEPSWQPPDFVFGIIWPYNFILLGLALYAIASQSSPIIVTATLVIFAVSIFFALRWSYLFYSVHDLPASASALLVSAILTIPIMAATFAQSWKIGIALMPYQVWIFTAAALAHSYAANN